MADAHELVVYANWRCSAAVDAELLGRVDEAWDQADESFCSSPGDDDPSVLVLSFDLEAGSYEDAARRGQRRVEDFASALSLEGGLLSIQASDDDGYLDVTLE